MIIRKQYEAGPFTSAPCDADEPSESAVPNFLPLGSADTTFPNGTFDDCETYLRSIFIPSFSALLCANSTPVLSISFASSSA